jgi:hypothetical protein
MSTAAVTPQAEDVQYIKLPDGSYGKFRASADDTTIQGAIEKDFPGTFRPPAPHSTKGDVVPQPKMETSVAGRMFGGPTGEGEGSTLPAPKAQMAMQTKPSPAVGAIAASAPALMGAAAAGPSILSAAAKYPIISSALIGEARRIPYVGKYIPPYAEWLPVLMGGKGKAIPEAAEEAEAKTLAAPKSGGKAIPVEDYEAPWGKAAAPKPAPAIRANPEKIETKSIQESMRDNFAADEEQANLEASRDFARKNSMDRPKSSILRDVRSQQADQLEKKARAIRAGKKAVLSPKPGTVVPAPDEDLTDILTQSVKRAKAKSN